jgi:hypothetical protein
MNTMTKVGSTLYIHDSGSVICADHAGFELAGEIAHNPKSFEYWTVLGTWVVAGARDYLAFKNGTGFDLACESCTDWSAL